jgi:hypothetical protein
MGLDLSFTAQNDQFEIRPTKADWDLLMLLGKSYAKEVELVCGVDDFGMPRRENRVAVLEAVEFLIHELQAESKNLPFVYAYRFVGGILDGESGSGRTGGIQIGRDGFYYTIEAGLGECVLIKKGVKPDGWGFDLERRDIRDLKRIQTDNFGEIRIYRKKKASRLKTTLEELKDFLGRNSDETVIKVMG